MAKVTFILEDHDGAVACMVHFDQGFQPDSHAHQHGQILIKMMDDLCAPKEEPTVLEKPAPRLVLAKG